ncbi:hypothetical protein [Paenibacillus sp. L3-i20]|uniref:hypothetical protein n=1 Tax=Paenibacillus sp. L3-i20 TaxID=2905833 RepID=UPI001EE03AC3|nr:hypothetical protein [Paenibacillus sp. L3-i20]GKU79309.1 hypothetical protein L3i20_v237060 [Paenibacillus sp. L3-i20]
MKKPYEIPRCDCGEELRAVIVTTLCPTIKKNGKELHQVRRIVSGVNAARYLRCLRYLGNQQSCNALYVASLDDRGRLVRGERTR